MHINTSLLVISFLALGHSSSYASSDLGDELLLSDIKRGDTITRFMPRYPESAAMRGQEGWVIMSYVIDKEGNVVEPIIESSSNKRVFNRSALKAIHKWKFEPSTMNNKAVEQCRNSVRFDYKLEQEKPGARKDFVKRYKEVAKLLQEKSYAKAKERLDSLKSRGAWNLYEDAWFTAIEADYYREVGASANEIASLINLWSASDNYFTEKVKLSQLSRLYSLLLDKKRFVTALSVAASIKQLDTKALLYPKVAKSVLSVEKYIATGSNYHVKSHLNSEGMWSHNLARNAFGFAGNTSNLRKIELRCDNKFLTYAVKPNVVWDIPKQWGSCRLYVYGNEQTAVDLVEIMKQA